MLGCRCGYLLGGQWPTLSKLTKKTVPTGSHEVGAQYVDALTCQHALVDKRNVPGERIATLEGKRFMVQCFWIFLRFLV